MIEWKTGYPEKRGYYKVKSDGVIYYNNYFDGVDWCHYKSLRQFTEEYTLDGFIGDDIIYDTYIKGFNDELRGIYNNTFNSILSTAYILGKDHTIIGDDVKSIDSLSKENILKQIYNYD